MCLEIGHDLKYLYKNNTYLKSEFIVLNNKFK